MELVAVGLGLPGLGFAGEEGFPAGKAGLEAAVGDGERGGGRGRGGRRRQGGGDDAGGEKRDTESAAEPGPDVRPNPRR